MAGKFSKDWDSLDKKLDTMRDSNNAGDQDVRFYRPRFSKDETCSALIRFLPGPGDTAPMVYTYKHFFQGRNGKLEENCLTMIGRTCPICEENNKSWNSGDQQTARDRGRRKGGIANILVINDINVPQNNGKVFLYAFGAEVMKKIELARNPASQVQKKVRIFDYYSGANFILQGKKVAQGAGKRPDWSDSSFEAVSAIGTDDFIEKGIEPSLVDLAEFIDEKLFKSYDALKANFEKVIGVYQGNQVQNDFQKAQTQAPLQQPVQQQTFVQQTPLQQPVQQQNLQPQQGLPPEANADPVTDGMSDEDFFNSVKQSA